MVADCSPSARKGSGRWPDTHFSPHVRALLRPAEGHGRECPTVRRRAMARMEKTSPRCAAR
ncbi:hypothetical protein METUNv1_01149 [Methyloversatilis universalis FAM5]|uniref:Uncharacterized protein n=1 Tax=Methyloversatilis universalis (strain ATCC BAA-1314 / DSM 25237 / JCM 13912 / CCUG 52030 / FAM5) TaxID=1000565 RepID=F5RA69_METUF|nr:hypothetical protein METUNv1_01149 [Methyloversatilis universalis FAM5]